MNTYTGLYRGIITNNNDPSKAGRVEVIVSALGTSPLVNWAVPRNSFMVGASQGQIIIPEIGTKVWVEFEHGNIDYPVYSLGSWLGYENLNGLEDIETGQVYKDGEIASKYLLRTKNLLINLNEKDGNVEIHRQDVDESSTWWQRVKRYISVIFNKDFLEIKKYNETESANQTDEEPQTLGKISLTNNSFSVEMFTESGDKFGTVELTPNGIELNYTPGGNEKAKIILDGSGVKMDTKEKINLKSDKEVNVNAPKVNVDSPKVNLNGETTISGIAPGTTPGFCSLPVCAFTGVAHTIDKVGT